MKKTGFILIEILIYIFLSSIFILLLYQFSIQTILNYHSLKFSNPKIHFATTALNLLEKDIRKAYRDNLVIKGNNEQLIMNHINANNSYNVGWLIKDQNLYRIHGNYNLTLNNWTNKIESLVCQNVNKFIVNLNKSKVNNNIAITDDSKVITIFLEVIVHKKNISFKKSIYPRSGIIK